MEHGIPARPDTVYKIGSVSKQFIATGIMLLVQDGKVAVDDKVSKYLEGTPSTWQAITLRHLLTHTSGLVREGPGFDPYKVQPDIDVIKTAYPLPLQFKPGDKYEYSNLGYFVLAEIIHKVSGKPWGDFLTERVFAPLGNDRHAGDQCRGHRPKPRRWLRVECRTISEHGKLAGCPPKRCVLVDCPRHGEVGGCVAHGSHPEGFKQEGDVDAGGTE